MDDEQGRNLWLLVPRPVRRLPADLVAVIALVAATNLAVLAPVLRETALRIVLGLPFVLFLPGYAFIAALFPEAGEGPATPADEADEADEEEEEDPPSWRMRGQAEADDTGGLRDRLRGILGGDGESQSSSELGETTRDRGIDGIERVALSFGLSIAIVPLLGLVLNYTPWGIRLVPILVTVSAFTLGSAVVAAVRRWELDPEDRFRVPYEEWIAQGRAELFEPDDRVDVVLNVALVASLLLAAGSVGYAVAVPKPGEQFTEFYILTESEDGDLVADGYPQNFTAGEARSLHVGITNNEHERVTYSVVVLVQDVRFANNSTTVLAEREVDRFRAKLEHNETWLRQREVAPTLVGDRLRLTFLLYRGDPPADPTVEDAYRELHLWVNVSASGQRLPTP